MKRNANMLNGPLWSSLITYTVPIILTSILQLLFNAADLVIVGRFSGSINVAAVSATGSITNLIVNLFIGLSIGAGVTVAHAIGGNHNQEVHRTVHTALRCMSKITCKPPPDISSLCTYENLFPVIADFY